MPGILANYAMRAREAQESDLGYIKFLSLLIQDEMISRESNNLEKRLRSAGFAFGSTFEEFDFSFNREALPAAMIRDLATCNFIHKTQNLVICGPPGIGKSHIAQAIGHEACRRQMDVLFRKTSKLIRDLSDSLYPKRVIRLMKKATHCNLLILDDFAFRKYSQEEAELLYAIADERLGKKSTILTSNRPPEDWYSIFPDPVIGGAILDRLVSGSIKIMAAKGKSYRKENAKTIVDRSLNSV
jgi:DNA replication protein DnaC